MQASGQLGETPDPTGISLQAFGRLGEHVGAQSVTLASQPSARKKPRSRKKTTKSRLEPIQEKEDLAERQDGEDTEMTGIPEPPQEQQVSNPADADAYRRMVKSLEKKYFEPRPIAADKQSKTHSNKRQCSICGFEFSYDLPHYKCIGPDTENLNMRNGFQCAGAVCAVHFAS